MPTFLNENAVLRETRGAVVGRTIRLLWIPPGGDEIAVIDVLDKMALPTWLPTSIVEARLESGELEMCEDDPVVVRRDSQLSDNDREARDRRYEVIRPLVEDKRRAVLDARKRGILVQVRAEEARVSKKYVYQYLRLWWRLGQLPNALLRDYSASGAKGKKKPAGSAKRGRPRNNGSGDVPPGVNIDEELLGRMMMGKQFLTKRSQKDAWEETKAVYFSTQEIQDGRRIDVVWPAARLPTFRQFQYHVIQSQPRGALLRAKVGDTAFGQRYRSRTGTYKDASFGPGSLYQVDSTIADIYLRSHFNPERLVGRPVLYIVADVYSRMLVGFHVALVGPSWETCMLALENTMTDKVASCALHGIDIDEDEWPCKHVPRNLIGDRGPELVGGNNSAAAAALKYHVLNLKPYTPDWKGLIESRFKLIDDGSTSFAPGAMHDDDRGGAKHKDEAVYTMAAFNKLIIQFIRHYNRSFEIDNPPSDYRRVNGAAPHPIDLWNYGREAHGALQFAGRNRVRQSLLPSDIATPSDRGLRFKGMHYVPAVENDLHWFNRVPGTKWAKKAIRYDPRSASFILLEQDRGSGFDVFKLGPHDREYEGLTFDEVADAKAMKVEAKHRGTDQRHASRARFKADVADIDREAQDLVQGISLDKMKGMAIREERGKEAREIRRENAWIEDPTHDAPPPHASAPRLVLPTTPAPAPTPAAAPVDPDYYAALLKARLQARKKERE